MRPALGTGGDSRSVHGRHIHLVRSRSALPTGSGLHTGAVDVPQLHQATHGPGVVGDLLFVQRQPSSGATYLSTFSMTWAL